MCCIGTLFIFILPNSQAIRLELGFHDFRLITLPCYDNLPLMLYVDIFYNLDRQLGPSHCSHSLRFTATPHHLIVNLCADILQCRAEGLWVGINHIFLKISAGSIAEILCSFTRGYEVIRHR